ncbi:hypothetical protein J7T55_011509 [Diaporthe amygdali]|uniref:uncharacterized protein n=1 Tax=Phomopsis amygdali TaxID=1214568 RepID=UPI0022FF42AD|nr:uncharacterized protein J7T55_011509 [Diaporthe amygdali]KAJ0123046.1 hypothetical protein J7T55_011509 [Diaporthe amygdali]
MSNTGGDDGDGNAPPSAEITSDTLQNQTDESTAEEPGRLGGTATQSRPDNGGGPSSEPAAAGQRDSDDGGTQDISATVGPQQVDDPEATPVPPRRARPQGSDTSAEQTPSPSQSGPETPSRPGGFMSSLTRWIGGTPTPRSRQSSTTAGGSTGNVTPTSSNPAGSTRSRPGSFIEETATPSTVLSTPGLVGPSRSRLNSQGSSSQGSAGPSSQRPEAGSRQTRANTGLSVNTEAGDFEAVGENTPTPIGARGHPFSAGADDNADSLPTTPFDPQWELTRRNRSLLGIYEIIRTRGVATNFTSWDEGRDRIREWRFQIGTSTLDVMADEGVASMRDVLARAGANVPDVIQAQILQEVRRRGHATRDTVNNALVDETAFLDRTANNIVDLIDSANTQGRQRGASSTRSFGSQSSQPEPAPMERRALMRNTREQLVDIVLATEQRRLDNADRVAELEDEAAATAETHETELRRGQAEANNLRAEHRRQIQDLQTELDYYRDLVEGGGVSADPPVAQAPVPPSPSQSESQESAHSTRPRSQTGSPPRSPAREQAFEDLRTIFADMVRHEGLMRRLQERAGLEPEPADAATPPWSVNAQLSRAGLLLQLRTVAGERNEARESENRLQARVDALEAARASPPSQRNSGLFANLFGGNRQRQPSSADSGSRSGSHGNLDTPTMNLADELEAQGSGQSSAVSGQPSASGRQLEASGRQSSASERQSNASSSQSWASARQSGASDGQPEAANPAPLRVIPEWLATHPNEPCGDCVPTFRFPPDLGELPTCGCTCDLALGNPPPSAAGSSRSGSSRSRASSNRSVRFADDGTTGDQNNGRRRPDPLDLSALTITEEDDADRPGTPYPAGADGGQPGASASDAQLEAPVLAISGGARSARCPCCGRGAYGNPPAAGGPQVAFYTCRNMAGQREPPPAEAPMSLAEGLRDVFASAAGIVAPGARNRANTDPLPGRGPGAPAVPVGGPRGNAGPPPVGVPGIPPRAHGDLPGRRRAPRDPMMTILTLFWDLLLLPLLKIRDFFWVLWSMLRLLWEYALYLNLRYVAQRNVIRPIPIGISMLGIWQIVAWIVGLWFITILIAVYEERRIWKAANAHITAAYVRGAVLRRPYPWWSVFQIDYGLLRPAFGRFSEWLHGWYFGR